MKENPGDIVMNKILDRKRAVSDIMATRFKGTKPFGVEPLSAQAKIWARDNLGTEDMMTLIQEFGDGAMNEVLYEINKLEMDGRRTRWQVTT